MKFTPLSDKELSEQNLLPVGEYDFEITDATDRVSKAGNEMIELLMRVYRPDGGFVLINDYLMEKVLYKVAHACKACGLEDRYNAGKLEAQDFVMKAGRLKLKIQKDKEGIYPDKNVVADYIVPKSEGALKLDPQSPTMAKPKTTPAEDLNDDIPF